MESMELGATRKFRLVSSAVGVLTIQNSSDTLWVAVAYPKFVLESFGFPITTVGEASIIQFTVYAGEGGGLRGFLADSASMEKNTLPTKKMKKRNIHIHVYITGFWFSLHRPKA